MHYLLSEIQGKKNYLQHYWYSFKYMVHAVHAVYYLLYKILEQYGNEGMCSKSDYHELLHGPRPINQNVTIFHEPCKFVLIQIYLVAAQLRFYLSVPFQDNLTKLLFRLMQFMEKLIWYENSCTGYFVDGVPVKLNWL